MALPLTTAPPLSPEMVLALADAARALPAASWSFALLREGFPGHSDEALLALPLGARDAGVMALRKAMGQGPIVAEPVCETCGTQFELTLAPEDIGFDQGQPVPSSAPVRVVVPGAGEQELRPVSLADMIAIENIADLEAASRVLVDRVGAQGDDLAGIGEALESLDALANIWLRLECPECGAEQRCAFDPVSYLAQELTQIARRLMEDVSAIARVFHWSERDILALPPSRRAYYVEAALG